jgi:parallel beta-helix repeat protein
MIDSSPIIKYNTISVNVASINGGGIYSERSSPTIQYNTISGNTTGNVGGGICIINCPSPTYIVTIGGETASDTSDFNTICGNTPDQIHPDIGETGPAGGLIFYDKGEVSDGWRYLEAALSDQHYIGDYTVEWGCLGTLILGADGTAVGTGEQNTIDIENGCATAGTAADICANLSLGGYSDWFLPSKDELNLMYTNLKVAGVGDFESTWYWSSSEINENYAWYQNFTDGSQGQPGKHVTLRVRAARAF